MFEEKISLWTIHSPDFDLSSGLVDHSKSEYYLTVPGVRQAYHELWRRLNTPKGQIIWCYTENDNITKSGTEKILWELQIPHKKVLCFLDSLIWNRILGIRCGVGNTLRRKWMKEANEKCPDDSHSYFEKCVEDFWGQKPKTGSWWDELFVQRTGECVDAIIHHPVPEYFIKKRITWFCGPS